MGWALSLLGREHSKITRFSTWEIVGVGVPFIRREN